METKFIFVTGGVVSSLGKGITAASLGRLLKCRGFKVVNQKIDPYINVDPGTMSPYQHGEVFVTDDGAETDLDLGHYERFIDENLSRVHSITAGAVYLAVIDKERRGEYLGRTVQVIPHVTTQIKECVLAAAKDNPDFVISEIGGTVGDIEGLPFLEAARQLRMELGSERCLFIHVTLVPFLSAAGEAKTKPTQHSVKELRAIGIHPAIIVCRADRPLTQEMREKISLFCDVDKDAVIVNNDAKTLYEVPLLLEKQGLDSLVCKILRVDAPKADLSQWRAMVDIQKSVTKKVSIALVGKYVELPDAYLSVAEALAHGGIANKVAVDIRWIMAETINYDNAAEILKDVDGILVPGGFGERGLEGKIAAINYARINNIPFFGICLGMQLMAIEFARNVLGFKEAHSTEIDKNTPYPIIDLTDEQRGISDVSSPMRLGLYDCHLLPGTLSAAAYGVSDIQERHRHRYEFNNKYREDVERAGFKIAGINRQCDLVEILELPAHPWYVGVQFHPEFKSRPNRVHPLFEAFIAAAEKGGK